MPRPTLEQVRASGRIITNYNWSVHIVRPPAIPFNALGLSLLDLRCVTATEPNYTAMTPNAFTVRSHTITEPGIVRPTREFGITVVETDLLDMRRLFVPWLQACHDPVTGIATPSNLVTADLLLTRMSKQDIPLWEYMIIGAFPVSFSDGEGSFGAGEGAGPHFITCAVGFAYTYFKQGFPGLSVAQPSPVVL